MESILKQLITEIKENDLDTKLKILSDKIFEQEKENITHLESLPTGPNIFLALEVLPQENKKVSPHYLCLERDLPGQFFLSLWIHDSRKKIPIRQKSIPIKASDHTEEKILKEFAKLYKMYNVI